MINMNKKDRAIYDELQIGMDLRIDGGLRD
jgi:hypothetical protein